MSDREDRLKSLLDKVRAKRPGERAPHAADVLERIRTASGAIPAVQKTAAATPPPAAAESPASSDFSSQLPASPLTEPDTSPAIESPTRYSSQPPQVERPLSVEPRARSSSPASGAPMGPISSAPPRPSSGAPRAPSSSPVRRPDSIRAQSFAPTGQPIVYATDEPEFPRPKTFGDLLELTLSLRPR